MAAVTPVTNAYYVNQAAPFVSQQVANAQNAVQFQAALAQQLFSQQDKTKLHGVTQADADHAIDEKEHHSPQYYEQEHKKKEQEDTEEEKEHKDEAHLLDLKA